MKFWKIIIFLSLIVFVLGIYIFKKTSFSKEVLKIEILGPEKISIGETAEYLIKYKNNGTVRLENVLLYYQCPESSLAPEGSQERAEIVLPDIYPGQEKNYFFKCIIFGKENDKKTAKAFIIFSVKNLKSRFKAESTFTTILKPIPLTFEFDLPSRVEPEKPFRFYINYFSNSPLSLSQLKIRLFLPEDFEILNQKPEPSSGLEWEIPVLNEAEGGKIEISGKILGEVGEQKLFKASLLMKVKDDLFVLKEIFQRVEITKPTIFLRQEINGNPQYIASLGDLLHYKIFFKNIGDKTLEKLTLISQLEGEAFDLNTIEVKDGLHQSGDNSIIFDWQKNPKLRILEPMEEGEIEFWVKLKENISGKNFILKHKIFLGPAKEEFITKIKAKIELSQKGFYQDEVFGNSGPLPPEIGQLTTYTIFWRIKNISNDLASGKLRAKLEKGVKMIAGKFFPEEESLKFSFDSVSGELFYNLGDLKAGQEKTIVFQIEFSPQPEHKGKIVPLISNLILEAEDTFTKSQIIETGNSLDTQLKEGENLMENLAKVK